MVKIKYLFIILIFFFGNTTAQTTKILFIGNSYTAYNNLPNLVYSMALANGDTIITNSYTPGGYTFEQHSTDSTTQARIYSQQWDYVVLQEQSQRPSFSPAQVAADVYPYASALDSMIHDNNACSETVFYMTWGRKNGDANNCAAYPPVCTYEGMQQRLRESYMEMALQNNSTVSPVGAAFSYVRSLNPAFDLYFPDESHPSIYGSYLAACVFYATIFHKTPVGNSFISTISQQDAAFLQNAAHAVVIDSLSTWYQYGNIPYASFDYTVNNNTVQFTNTSLNATSYNWTFHDGTLSQSANPTFIYPQPGVYYLNLLASTTCKFHNLYDSVMVGSTGLTPQPENCNMFFDNSSQNLTLDCEMNLVEQLTVYDLQGRKVKSFSLTGENTLQVLNFSDLTTGIYLVKTEGNGTVQTFRIAITPLTR